MKTPITYWGGKQKLISRILPLIPPHRQYDEPFFGGGAVFFAKKPSKIEFINDINGEMINFYRIIKYDFERLKDKIDCMLHSEFQQKQAIEIYLNSSDKEPVLRAWAVWVLSNQSFYAILDNTWKCSMERNIASTIQTKKKLFDERYVKRLESTSIFCRDALDVIRKTDRKDTFHYIDPPYFNADLGHYEKYTEMDFTRLLDVLSGIEGRFMLSSYPSEILSEYTTRNNWHTISIEMERSAAGGRKTEVLTMNYSNIPKQLNLF